jgi:hypothetical protein
MQLLPKCHSVWPKCHCGEQTTNVIFLQLWRTNNERDILATVAEKSQVLLFLQLWQKCHYCCNFITVAEMSLGVAKMSLL